MSPRSRSALAILVPALTVAAGFALPGIAGVALLYPALGLLPGLVIARLLPIEKGPLARLALGLAASPLVVTIPGWACLAAGTTPATAARGIAALAFAAWALLAWWRPPSWPWRETGARFALLWSTGAGAVVALPLLANEWLRVRSDTWIHVGIVQEILVRGVPPGEPRFAGLTLNYVWFYNLFLALASALGGDDPFLLVPLFNATLLAATLLVAWLTARRLWGVQASKGTVLLVSLGFNAGMWLLWPLRFIRALTGDIRGWRVVREDLSYLHLNDTTVISQLSAPFAYMASFLDKFLIGTAVAYAYLMVQVFLWALVVWLGARHLRALFWMMAAACGMLLFHGVVGISFVPVVLVAFALSALLAPRWNAFPGFSALAWPAFATVVGALAAAPYTRAISQNWAPDRSGIQHRYLAIDLSTIWTLVSALLVALWLARRPLRRAFEERLPAPSLLALITLGLALFAVTVKLPILNHVKFVYETFIPLTLIAGVQFAGEASHWMKRLGRPRAFTLGFLVFLGGPLFTLIGYSIDATGRSWPALNPRPGETALYAWARTATPADAVFLDRGFRSDIMVRSGRQLLLGSSHGPELAAWPLSGIRERTAVIHDLFGARDSLVSDIRTLAALERPVYVVMRPSDSTGVAAPLGPPFEPVYDRDGFVVYHLRRPATSGASR